jgi:hypothetical protein
MSEKREEKPGYWERRWTKLKDFVTEALAAPLLLACLALWFLFWGAFFAGFGWLWRRLIDGVFAVIEYLLRLVF